MALLELGDAIDGHSPTTFFVYLFLLEFLDMYIAWLGLHRGFCSSCVYIREFGYVGEALLMLVEACHVYNYDINLLFIHALSRYLNSLSLVLEDHL